MVKSRGNHETILNPSRDNISRNNKNHRVNGPYSTVSGGCFIFTGQRYENRHPCPSYE